MPKPLLALFDVDETLIRVKSMFSFLDMILSHQGWSEEDRQVAISRFQRIAHTGVSREHVNAAYYRGFAGLSRPWMLERGREWFLERVADDGLFHETVLQELRELRFNGADIALVSGSFEACLAPIAESVGAKYVLASEPTISGDVYTGELARPMIGAAKAEAAQLLIENLRLDRRRVRAYGDHISDAPLLRSAGEGVVVGCDPEMRRLAASEGWRNLPLVKH